MLITSEQSFCPLDTRTFSGCLLNIIYSLDSLYSLLDDRNGEENRVRNITWIKTAGTCYLVFDQISSIESISAFLHVAQGLLQKMLPIQLIPSFIYLN